MITIVIPTVHGRSEDYLRCYRSHVSRANLFSYTVVTEHNHDTCGSAWNAGWAKIKRAYRPGQSQLHVLFTADDLEAHPTWWQAALQCCASGDMPAPILYNADNPTVRWAEHDGPIGAVTAFPRVPFLSYELADEVFPIPPIHYYSDCLVGDRLRALGVNCRVMDGYAFTHHWSQVKRIRDDSRDLDAYHRELNRAGT